MTSPLLLTALPVEVGTVAPPLGLPPAAPRRLLKPPASETGQIIKAGSLSQALMERPDASQFPIRCEWPANWGTVEMMVI